MAIWAVGVDLGGTNVRAAEIGPDGHVGRVMSEAVDRRGDQEPFAQLVRLIRLLTEGTGNPPLGIGVGVTGPVDSVTGIIDNPFTLPASYQGDVRGALERAFSLPVVVENDANVAALAEARYGVARDRSVVVCITVGTGVGVGVVRDGRVHRGAGETHPEGGHMAVDSAGPPCYCGANGCIESLSSARAVHLAGATAGVVDEEGSARDVHEQAAAGNEVAEVIIDRGRRALAVGARNLVAVHAADAVVLAGNGLGDSVLLLDAIRAEVARYLFAPAGGVLVATSSLRGHAGCIGAASLVMPS